jgi:hypothetical protein
MDARPARRAANTNDRNQHDEISLARRVVVVLSGRFSSELGIDIAVEDTEIERWFLAATLFGTRISAGIAERTFRELAAAGLARIDQVGKVPAAELVELLDAGGYARYDFRTAARLHKLSEVVCDRFGGHVASIRHTSHSYPELSAVLDALPGWGEVTVRLFLRELRGVWPGAQPPFDGRAATAARHLRLVPSGAVLSDLAHLANLAGLDVRDLESGLVRLTLGHHRAMASCPGGQACTALQMPADGGMATDEDERAHG